MQGCKGRTATRQPRVARQPCYPSTQDARLREARHEAGYLSRSAAVTSSERKAVQPGCTGAGRGAGGGA
jgi:hypothetical protein